MGAVRCIPRGLMVSAALILGVGIILFAMINAIGSPIEILLANQRLDTPRIMGGRMVITMMAVWATLLMDIANHFACSREFMRLAGCEG